MLVGGVLRGGWDGWRSVRTSSKRPPDDRRARCQCTPWVPPYDVPNTPQRASRRAQRLCPAAPAVHVQHVNPTSAGRRGRRTGRSWTPNWIEYLYFDKGYLSTFCMSLNVAGWRCWVVELNAEAPGSDPSSTSTKIKSSYHIGESAEGECMDHYSHRSTHLL